MKTLKRLLILVMIFAMTLTACQKQPASQGGDGQNSEVVNTQQDTQQGEEGQAGEEEIVVQKSAILEQGTTRLSIILEKQIDQRCLHLTWNMHW